MPRAETVYKAALKKLVCKKLNYATEKLKILTLIERKLGKFCFYNKIFRYLNCNNIDKNETFIEFKSTHR